MGKAMVLIDRMIDNPAVLDLLRHPEFREKYKPAWYQPAEAHKFLGSQWFIDEVEEYGMPWPSTKAKANSKGEHVPNRFTWHEVGRWYVNGDKTTDSFTISGRKWKISWRIPADGQVGIGGCAEDGSIVANINASQSDSSIVHEGPGRYYPEIGTVSPSDIWVEEYTDKPATDKQPEKKTPVKNPWSGSS